MDYIISDFKTYCFTISNGYIILGKLRIIPIYHGKTQEYPNQVSLRMLKKEPLFSMIKYALILSTSKKSINCLCITRIFCSFFCEGCDKRPSKLGITYYEQNTNNYWLTMVCALGTAFSSATCDCSIHLRINHVNNNPLGPPVSK